MSDSTWHVKTIRELGAGKGSTVQTGPFGSQLHADDYVEDGIPFILIRNIGDSGLKENNLPRISFSDANRLARYNLKPGDIVFSRVGRTGSCLLATDNEAGWIISGQTLRLRLENPDLDCRFLLYALQSYEVQNFISKSSVGTTRESLNTKILQSIPVSHPSYREQRRIAKVLSTLDETIEQTEALIAKYQQIKAGLMHDLFTRGVTPDGKLRPTRAEAPQLYKESPLGWIPKEWEVKALSKCTHADITYGIVQAGPHVEGGVPYIRTGDMDSDSLDRDSLLCTSRQIAKSYKRSTIRAGELVCAIRATVGTVLPVPPELDGANLTQGTARIAPNAEIDAGFLLWSLRSDRVQRSIQLCVKGTTFSEITLRDLRNLSVAVPSDLLEQQAISKRLYNCEAKIQSEKTHLNKLQMKKHGLMHDLLTGRVRVKVDG